MYRAHPLCITLCKIIIYGNDMYAVPLESVEVGGKRRDERLSFTCTHLRDTPLMEDDAADQLDLEMLHIKSPLSGLTDYRIGLGENVIERLAL